MKQPAVSGLRIWRGGLKGAAAAAAAGSLNTAAEQSRKESCLGGQTNQLIEAQSVSHTLPVEEDAARVAKVQI